jgi:ECF transporter S component (folate family)
MTVTSMFIALAVVTRVFFSLDIPLFGISGMRIGLYGVFYAMPAVLFGPVYGMAAAALYDLLQHFARPVGAFMPQLTLIMALGGFARGLFWQLLRERSAAATRVCVAGVSAALVLLGAFNLTNAEAGYDVNLIACGGFGAALLLIDWLMSRRYKDGVRTLPLLVTMQAAGLLVSTLNTLVLRAMFYADSPFMAVWVPRAVSTMLTHTVYVYFMALLLVLYKKLPQGRTERGE